MNIRGWILGAAMTLTSVYGIAEPQPPLNTLGDVRNYVLQLVGYEQVEELDKLLDQLNAPNARTEDGRWKMSGINEGLQYYFCNDQAWESSRNFLVKWRKATPKSPSAAFAEAAFWRCYAWDARGGGYANSVTPQGWKLFKERLTRSEEVLTKAKSYTSQYPLWYAMQYNNAVELGKSPEYASALQQESLARHKYFYQTYFDIARSLTPKWGGDWDALDKFVGNSVVRTKDVEGDALYARIYWAVDQQYDTSFNLFKDSRASWPKMKKGFEDLMQRYPKSNRNLNAYASFACRAGDKATFLQLKQKIGEKNFVPDVWRSNYSYDLCENIFKGKAL